MKAAEVREMARGSLHDRWGGAVLNTFLALLMGATVLGYASGYASVYGHIAQWTGEGYSAATQILGVIGTILSIVSLIIGGAMNLGIVEYHQRLAFHKEADTYVLVSYFKDHFTEAFLTNLLVDLFVLLWSLLLVIPGIVMAYAYSMTFFLMQENPDLKAMDAIRASRTMMKGRKWKLFCLDLSFIGWALLCALTAGLGNLLLMPYVMQAHTIFYNNARWEQTAAQQADAVSEPAGSGGTV